MNTEDTTEAQAWSLPEHEVLSRMAAAQGDDADYVVATLADVEGSAYRRPGAKMLMSDAGSVGSVTAGCLTAAVENSFEAVHASGEARIERFDLTDDEEWGAGLGCNGVVDLLLEPLDNRFTPLLDSYTEGREGVALVVLDAEGAPGVEMGDREFVHELSDPAGSTIPDWLHEALSAHVRDRIDAGNSGTVTVTGPAGECLRIYIDPILRPPHLYIFGGGNDVHPVSDLAKKAGFKVTVAPFRGGQADPDSFPHADRVVSTSAPRIGESLSIHDDAYAVVMSHNLVDDRLVVESLLDSPARYIGLMGPRDRFDRIRDALASDGRQLSDADNERLYAPIGLDIGGGEPYQIATSIVSEMIAVHYNRPSGHLRDRSGPIHNRGGVD